MALTMLSGLSSGSLKSSWYSQREQFRCIITDIESMCDCSRPRFFLFMTRPPRWRPFYMFRIRVILGFVNGFPKFYTFSEVVFWLVILVYLYTFLLLYFKTLYFFGDMLQYACLMRFSAKPSFILCYFYTFPLLYFSTFILFLKKEGKNN